ncbi:tetratricopeptide repeat protein [Fretibacter rubidus]|uniref:tetratricopeptide repeat protein n=1 Tax=Fretibacter rubidus TaxID=570162 RepID=UPI00352AE574
MTNKTLDFHDIDRRIKSANGGEALARAVEDMRQLAKTGHLGAANNYGTCAQFGRGTEEDMACARHYYALAARGNAAQSGLAVAQFNLGFMWLHGLGGDKREATAHRWFIIAADGGDTDALTHLGRMSMTGQGCARDTAAGFAYWRRGADLGDGRCAFNLGVATAGGHAGEADLNEGLMWFYIAKALGADGATAAIAKIEAVLTGPEIEIAKTRASQLDFAHDRHAQNT